MGSDGMSGRIMAADLPPSSSWTRLIWAPQISPMRLPTPVDPVKPTMSTRGSFVIASPTAALSEDVSTFTAPAGTSVRVAMISARKFEHQEVVGAPLSTTVQPAAIAHPSFFRLMSFGTFQGVIAPNTPTGSRRT